MKGAGRGVAREGAIRDRTSEEITRGTHLTAAYPALFQSDIPVIHRDEIQNELVCQFDDAAESFNVGRRIW